MTDVVAESRSTILQGFIKNGQVCVGDEIKVISTDSRGETKEIPFVVQAIKCYTGTDETVNRASAVERVVGLVVGTTSETISKGDAVVNTAGPFVPTDMIVGTITVFEGSDPLNNGDTVTFHYGGPNGFDVTAELGGIGAKGGLQPKHSYYDVIFDELSYPLVVFRGQRLSNYQNGTQIANYTVDENQ